MRAALVPLVCLLLLAGAPPASAAPTLTVGGRALHGSTVQPGAVVRLDGAPAGTTAVTWVLGGQYVGTDRTAPYELALAANSGPYVLLKARVETAGGQVRLAAAFTVGGTPAPLPVGGQVRVSTGAQLTAALAAARPGTTITLADGRYVGRFRGTAAGAATAPVVLRGSRAAVLDGGTGGYVVHLDGARHWRLEGFRTTGGGKGVVLDRTRSSVLSRLDVGGTGAEAVHLRAGSSDNVVADSLVHHTGLRSPGFGEGVYVGSARSNWGTHSGGQPDRSDRNAVLRNRIWATTAESVDVKEGTTGGRVVGNTFDGAALSGANSADSWVDLKGNGWTVRGNRGTSARLDGVQTHVVAAGWGRGNVLAGNVLDVRGPGYGVRVQDPVGTGTVVRCDNRASGAALGVANLPCR